MPTKHWTFKPPSSSRQDLQEGTQRQLCLPKRAEDRFFEGSTYASKIYGAFLADEDELTGDEPRQFADLENATGRAIMDHGSPHGA